jgi:phosphohistidine phosphatase SixA
MKNHLFSAFLAIILFSSCQKDKEQKENETPPAIVSAEYIDDLLFVNKNDYKIETAEPATFSSSDTSIRISSDGVVARITSGEVVAIDVAWTNRGTKTKLYAVGATDDNHVNPFEKYHDERSSDPFNQYVQGWKTLRKLPIAGESWAIILRHADADNGRDFNLTTNPGPPDWWKSCDSTLARQLNTVGVQRATELGKVFKDLQLPISRVFSSEFCRAIKTAELVNAGPAIAIDGRINHPAYNRRGSFRGLVEILNEQTPDNKITLVSAHHPINEFASVPLPTFPNVSAFNWTGAYFVKIAADKSLTYQGAASYGMFKYWRDLKLKKL